MADKKIITDELLKLQTEKVLQVIADNVYSEEEYSEQEINDMFDATPEKLAYYESLIQDDTVSLNRIFSSKKVSDLIAEGILEANKYTDQASVRNLTTEIVSSTTDVIKENVLYLILSDASTNAYEQYMLIGGTATALGSTKVDLSNIYNKSEIDTKLDNKANKSEVLSIDSVQTIAGSETNDTVYSSKLTKDELDKKVNVTDVVDNLTSTDTNKPLSAKQGKVLEDNKLNKTDIVTTINSTSTDDTIPSAKTINTELDKINNNLGEKADVNKVAKKIYIKDVSSEDARTLIQNHWNEFDRFEFYNLRIDTAKWAWNAEIYAHTQEYGTVLLMSYGSDVPRVFYGRLYNGVWTWKELATVDNAKDVGVTTITPVNSAITGTIEYTVKNGICYVSMRDLMSTISSTNLLISTTMPKPSINCSDSSVNASGNIAMIYIDKGTTNLYGNFYTKNAKSDCSFSYPVAE